MVSQGFERCLSSVGLLLLVDVGVHQLTGSLGQLLGHHPGDVAGPLPHKLASLLVIIVALDANLEHP